VLVLIVGCIFGGVFCYWLSGVAWLLSADCRLSGVAVSDCCWFLVVGLGVGCGSAFFLLLVPSSEYKCCILLVL
jgi:hypothetical protein